MQVLRQLGEETGRRMTGSREVMAEMGRRGEMARPRENLTAEADGEDPMRLTREGEVDREKRVGDEPTENPDWDVAKAVEYESAGDEKVDEQKGPAGDIDRCKPAVSGKTGALDLALDDADIFVVKKVERKTLKRMKTGL
ncbi:hypothetical protein HPP92_010626 [Vanilla planifolia]|uniref:Uncharacterized protein n=1 Tax=Vanilla planifolia TaxID=51239 RepID=A0A835V206_VANPL|nr:hypothetical protein HPP92_010626 [Vanilla planifolia]